MHPTILAIAGYTLLLSSLVTLLIVIRRGCKRKIKSQFYILSTSDILNSVFTAIILLVNHVNMITNHFYIDENNNNKTYSKWEFNTTKEYDYREIINQQFERYNHSEKIDDFIDVHCNSTSVLIHYAMLLLPMTNSFISLVLFALQCNTNMKCISQKCNALFEMERNCMQSLSKLTDNIIHDKVENTEGENLDHKTLRHLSSNTTHSRRNSCKNDVTLKTLENTVLQITSLRKADNRSGFIYVLSQWLIPVIITSILSLGEYHSMQSIFERKIDCAFSSNFPLYNCDTCTEASTFLQVLDTIQQSTLNNNYIISENLTDTSSLNTAEVNDVVSKVYTIIQSVLNFTHKASNVSKLADYELSDLLPPTNQWKASNTTDAKLHNSEMEDAVEITVNDQNKNVTDSLNKNTDERTDYLDLESWPLNDVAEKPEELNITEMKNMNEEVSPSNHEETTVLYPGNITDTVHKKNETHSPYNNSQETTTRLSMISKEQIYADILKRIQGINRHSTYNNKYKESRYYDNKRSKQNDFAAESKNNNFLLTTKMNEGQTNIENLKLPLCMSDKYFISTAFLKLYLFMLTILMYLFPIIFSIILQTHGTILHKSILNRIETNVALICASNQLQINSTVNENSLNKSMSADVQNELDSNSVNKQAYCNKDSDCQESTSADVGNHFERISEYQEPSENEQDSNYCDRKKLCNDMLQETNEIRKIFQVTKISLLLSIFLWTPVFLEILLKVYLCLHIPTWVLDTSFLGAISFGILRNIISLNIINIQDSNKVMNRKENSVYPTL